MNRFYILNPRGLALSPLEALRQAGFDTRPDPDGPGSADVPDAGQSPWFLTEAATKPDRVAGQPGEHGRQHRRYVPIPADELSNMLTIILGYVEIAREQVQEGHPAADAIEEIQLATERIAQLASPAGRTPS